jgi:allantoin racemase
MPKVLIINPNTSESMSKDIESTSIRVFQPPWNCIVSRPTAGPESLESWSDYNVASVAVLPLLEEYSDVNGILLACFGDPGLYALKEICDVPVVGIAEASISLSLLLGAKFGILAGMPRAVELMDSMVRTYGLEARYAGTQSMEMRVLDFEKDPRSTLRILADTSLKLRRNGAEVLLLGCAGLTTFVEDLQKIVDLPVIDPIEAGCRILKILCESNLNTSHVGLFSKPAYQNMRNLENVFSSEMSTILRKPR